MSFLTLNNNWSNLAPLYNQRFNNKPEVPSTKYSNFDDGLIRGGLINAGLASVRDGVRVGEFLASPKGLLFVAKQIGLQLANPPLESSGEVRSIPDPNNVAQNITTLSYKKDNPTRSYLGFNTLLQVPINAFGGHIIRHGVLPIGGGGFLENSTDNINGYNYEKITRENNTLSLSTTASERRNIFTPDQNDNKEYLSEVVVTNEISYKNAPNRLLQHLVKITKNPKTNEGSVFGQRTLLTYNGGANSVYGLGITDIKTSVDQRTNVINRNDEPKIPLLNGFKPKSYSIIDIDGSRLSSTVYRQSTIEKPIDLITQDNSLNDSELNFNIENRIGVSRIGRSVKKSIDSINTISILDNGTFYNWAAQATTPNSVNSNSNLFTYTKNTKGRSNGGSFARDIIKFRIEFINNNKAGNFTEVLVFRAYIDEFSDGMNAKWNPYRYMGRGEEFYVYDGFTRDISIGFTMYAHSPEEMRPLYQKLNYLMSSFAPDYNDKLKMRGNIAKLTVGDYLYQQPGVFTDIKLSGFLDTHWEIAMDEPEGGNSVDQYEVPKHIKVNLSFKPIHNFLPRRVMADNPNKAPFITRNDVNNKYLTTGETRLAPLTQEEYNRLPPRIENPSTATNTSLNLTNQSPSLTLNSNGGGGSNLWGSFPSSL